METLLNTDFFLKIKMENTTNIQFEYNDFIKKLFLFCKSAGDTMSAYFVLNYTRIEFVSVQNKMRGDRSKKK